MTNTSKYPEVRNHSKNDCCKYMKMEQDMQSLSLWNWGFKLDCETDHRNGQPVQAVLQSVEHTADPITIYVGLEMARTFVNAHQLTHHYTL